MLPSGGACEEQGRREEGAAREEGGGGEERGMEWRKYVDLSTPG